MEEISLKVAISKIMDLREPWFVENVEINKKTLTIDVFIDFVRGSKFECTECHKHSKVHDTVSRRARHLDFLEYRCYLNYVVPRTKCEKHGVKTIDDLPFLRKGSHFSFFFERRVMQLVGHMPMSAIAQYLGEIDTTLWRVFRHHVGRGLDSRLDLSQVKKVCVDETAIRRGHDYVTIFTDYDTGQVVYVANGRKKEVFDEFYGWLWDKGGHPGKIELFSMDMSKSFKAGQSEYFAHSEVVFDRFHIKKALNEAVDKVRKTEVGEFEILKNTKYLWLKNEQNLSLNERRELGKILEVGNLNTAIAYKLKNEFDMIWTIQKNAIEPALNVWVQRALGTAIKPIIAFVKTLNNHWKGILNAMKMLVNNGISEGINSKIQVAKSKARGYPNLENFKSMVYFIGNDLIYDFH